MSEWIANSDPTFQAMVGDLREEYRIHRYVKVKSTIGKKRTLNQNDISHVWYAQMAREDRQNDEQGHRRYCKLHHGVPILRAEDSDFRKGYDSILMPLAYELKLEAMDFMPVTSRMNKAQMTKYLDAVQKDYRRRNIFLEFPEAA